MSKPCGIVLLNDDAARLIDTTVACRSYMYRGRNTSKAKELGGDPLIPIHVAVVAASGHCEAARL